MAAHRQQEKQAYQPADNEEVAESFRVQFDMWWNQQTKTYEGKEAIQNLFKEMITFGDYSVLAENFLITEVLGEEFFIWWQEEKKRQGVKSKGVMNSQHKGSILLKEKTATDFKYIDNWLRLHYVGLSSESVGIISLLLDKKNILKFDFYHPYYSLM